MSPTKEKLAIGSAWTLSQTDQITVRELAKQRYESNRKANVRNQKIGKQTNEFTDLQGLGGEFTFCRLLDLEPDTTIHPRSSMSDNGDLSLGDGTKVDVKTTHYPTGKLLVVPWKVKNVEYYVLMVGTFPTFRYNGAMHRDEILKASRLGSLGYGQTYIAHQSELEELI